MRVRSLFVVVLSLLLPTSFGSITVAQSPTPEPRSAPGKVTVPLTKPDLPATEVVGFNDQGHSLTFQIRDAEVDPQDPQQEIYLSLYGFLPGCQSDLAELMSGRHQV